MASSRTASTLPSGRLRPAPRAHIHVGATVPYRVRGRLSLVRRAALAALAQARPGPRSACEWSIRLTNDAELHRLNQQFRGMDQPTDVLSFGGSGYRDGKPVSTSLSPPLEIEEAEYLGDIVISMERCVAQAAAGGHSVAEELALLVVHGTLHLLGYDHDTKTRKARMWSAQSRALQSLGIEISVP